MGLQNVPLKISVVMGKDQATKSTGSEMFLWAHYYRPVLID
jgi:hypothetical protein